MLLKFAQLVSHLLQPILARDSVAKHPWTEAASAISLALSMEIVAKTLLRSAQLNLELAVAHAVHRL
jgi:hypothetical protein